MVLLPRACRYARPLDAARDARSQGSLTTIARRSVEFEDAWSTRAEGTVEGVRVPVLGRDALIQTSARRVGTKTLAMSRQLKRQRLDDATDDGARVTEMLRRAGAGILGAPTKCYGRSAVRRAPSPPAPGGWSTSPCARPRAFRIPRRYAHAARVLGYSTRRAA